MVNKSTTELDQIFGALADPTRRAIIARLAEGEATVSDLSRPFEMSLPAVSKHLGILERARLINRRSRGRERLCSLNPQTLSNAHAWLGFYEQFWNKRLDALEQLLTSDSVNPLPGNDKEPPPNE